MSLLRKLGFCLQKPEVEVTLPEGVSEKLNAMTEKRKSLYKKDTVDTAAMYSDWLPTQVYQELCTFHDYKNVMWGSRKFGRLLNLCRNIVDIEVYKENPTILKEDEPHILRLLMWVCLIYPIAIVNYHKNPKIEDELSVRLKALLRDSNILTQPEFDLLLVSAFRVLESEIGDNIVLDIFHDALRWEEAQFGLPPTPIELMRTELGKNPVFSIKARKDSRNNLCPFWLGALQESKGLGAIFVDMSQAEEALMNAEKDGIGE